MDQKAGRRTAPKQVGPYRILERLGAGGMGSVYRGLDLRLERPVALKHVRPEAAASTKARERFRREMRALARLNHPSIVQIYDLVETRDGEWLVMELVEGHSLIRLADEAPVSPALVECLAREILSGLAVAHAAGIVHRDLKAANIMVTAGGRVKILDFGVAKRLDLAPDDFTVEGEILGTLSAMSPEQTAGDRVDPRSDLFAVGILLYALLTGKKPFHGDGLVEVVERIRRHHPPGAGTLRQDIPAALSDFVDRLLAKNPEDRPRDAAQALAELDAAAEGVGLETEETEILQVGAIDVKAYGGAVVKREVSVLEELTQALLLAEQRAAGDRSGPLSTGASRSRRQATGSWSSSSGLRLPPGVSLKTVLVTDLVGSTALVEQVGDGRAHHILTLHDRLTRDLLARHEGREIDKSDGFLLLFDRPADAVRFALDYHRELRELSEELGTPLEARVGMHFGEVYIHENTYSDVARGAKTVEVEGITKPIAARVMALARGSQTLLTRAACDLVRSLVEKNPDLRVEDWGNYRFKGVAQPIAVHEIGEIGQAPFTPPPRASRRIRSVGGAVLVISIFCVLGWLLVASGGRPSVALIGFKDVRDLPEDAWLATALREHLATELAANGEIRLAPGESVARFRREHETQVVDTFSPDTLDLLRIQLGVDYVLTGTYYRASDSVPRRLQVQFHLQETVNGERWSWSEEAPEDDLQHLVRTVGGRLRHALGLRRKASQGDRSTSSFSSSDRAMRLYFKGLEALRTLRAEEAKELLLEAVLLDDRFALAHAALSEAWTALDHDDEARTAARKAFQLADDLPRRDRILIEALYYTTRREWKAAAGAFDGLLRIEPDEIQHGLRLAELQLRDGRPLSALKTVAELRRDFGDEDPRLDLIEWDVRDRLAERVARLEIARAAIRKGSAMQAWGLEAEAWLRFGRSALGLGGGKAEWDAFERARELFVRAKDRGGEAETYLEAATFLRRAGRLDRAEEFYRAARWIFVEIRHPAGIAAVLAEHGRLDLLRGESAAAAEKFIRAVEIDRRLNDLAEEAFAIEGLGWAALARSDLPAAERHAADAVKLYQEVHFRAGEVRSGRLRSRIELARGSLFRASAAAELALELHGERSFDAEVGRLLGVLAEIRAASGEHEQALELLKRSEVIFRRLGEVSEALELRIVKARLEFARGAYRAAFLDAVHGAQQSAAGGREDLCRIASATAARALLRLGWPAASGALLREMGSAGDAGSPTEDREPTVRLAVDRAWIELDLADGRRDAARRRLTGLLRVAHQHDLVPQQVELRLLEVRLRAGDDFQSGDF